MSTAKRLDELALSEIRARMGRDPTLAEWLVLVRAARLQREFDDQVRELAALVRH